MIEYQSRFAFLPEVSGARIQAGLINEIAGGEIKVARRPHSKSEVHGEPVAIPILYAEAPPTIFGTTQGTVDRQKVIRFNALPSDKVDESFKRNAKDPESDIVKGCFMYICSLAKECYENGYKTFQEPAEVTEERQQVNKLLRLVHKSRKLSLWLM